MLYFLWPVFQWFCRQCLSGWLVCNCLLLFYYPFWKWLIFRQLSRFSAGILASKTGWTFSPMAKIFLHWAPSTRCWRILIALPPSMHLFFFFFVFCCCLYGSRISRGPFWRPVHSWLSLWVFSLGSRVSCILYNFRRTWFSCTSANTCVSSWCSWLYDCQVVFVSVFVFVLMI